MADGTKFGSEILGVYFDLLKKAFFYSNKDMYSKTYTFHTNSRVSYFTHEKNLILLTKRKRKLSQISSIDLPLVFSPLHILS